MEPKVADEPFLVAQIPPARARRALRRLFLQRAQDRENLVQGTQKKKGVGGVRTEQTRAISSGTTTEAVTRPASGRVDISAVRLRVGSRLSVQRESYCGICAVWPIRRLRLVP